MTDLPDEAARVAADSLMAKLGIVVADVEGQGVKTYRVGWRGTIVFVDSVQYQQLRGKFR